MRLECTYHSTHETYSPVGRRNLRIYWSGCQSTGADMRKYFTATVSGGVAVGQGWVETDARQHSRQVYGTYSYQPAEGQRCYLEASFAVRPGLIRRSQARQIVTEAAALPHGRWNTWCAATRSPTVLVFCSQRCQTRLGARMMERDG